MLNVCLPVRYGLFLLVHFCISWKVESTISFSLSGHHSRHVYEGVGVEVGVGVNSEDCSHL